MAQKAQSVGGTLLIGVSSDGKVSIEARFDGFLFQEGDTWVSVCPALDLSTCGSTKRQAMERTKEAIGLFFDSCIAHGTLDQALEQLRWRKEQSIAVDGLFQKQQSPQMVTPEFHVGNLSLKGSVWTGHATVC